MSSTGYWIIAAAPPDTVHRLRKDLPAHAFDPPSHDADVSWWQAMDQADLVDSAPKPGYTAPGPSDAAFRFADTLITDRPDDDALDTCLASLTHAPQDEIFHVGVRKGDPVAALYYGLGFADARLLPGRFGCFLLEPHAIDATLTTIGHLPHRPHVSRKVFKTRVAAWLAAVSDDADLDPFTLLDGPLRVLRRAQELRVGAIGLMQWF